MVANSIPTKTLSFASDIDTEGTYDANFVILNNRTSYSEVSKLCDLPHGLKDYTKNNILSIPDEKLYGILIPGKSNTLLDSKDFFHIFMRGFTEMTDCNPEIKNIQIISFRNIKQYEIIQMMQYAAGEARKQLKLYNADCERSAVKSEENETILREFHDAPLGGM